MSLMRKCCPCYHRKPQYESLAPNAGEPQSSQFYCCEHTRSTLIRNSKASDLENQENLAPPGGCDCNHKMDGIEDPALVERIRNTEDFMNVEKDELCKVWSEQKIRKEWTVEDVVSRDIFDRTTKKRWVDLGI